MYINNLISQRIHTLRAHFSREKRLLLKVEESKKKLTEAFNKIKICSMKLKYNIRIRNTPATLISCLHSLNR